MNSRLSQWIGWVSLILVLAVVNGVESGALTTVQMLWGSLIGVCGLLTALLGFCTAIRRAQQVQRVPVRTAHHARRR